MLDLPSSAEFVALCGSGLSLRNSARTCVDDESSPVALGCCKTEVEAGQCGQLPQPLYALFTLMRPLNNLFFGKSLSGTCELCQQVS